MRGQLKSVVHSGGASESALAGEERRAREGDRAIKAELMIREEVWFKWNYLVISDGYYG